MRSFSNDAFAANTQIEILEAADGVALCRMPILPMHLNAHDTVMGGAIFTLADFAAAIAAATVQKDDADVVSLHADISFLLPGTGTVLFARAQKVRHGGTTTLYEVDVTDESGKLIARSGVTGFILKKPEKSS